MLEFIKDGTYDMRQEGPFDLAGAHSTGCSCITLDILPFWFATTLFK